MSNTYLTGTGQRLYGVHDVSADCIQNGCAIHKPTSPNKHLPTHWHEQAHMLVRVRPDGTYEPDSDEMAFRARAVTSTPSGPSTPSRPNSEQWLSHDQLP